MKVAIAGGGLPSRDSKLVDGLLVQIGMQVNRPKGLVCTDAADAAFRLLAGEVVTILASEAFPARVAGLIDLSESNVHCRRWVNVAAGREMILEKSGGYTYVQFGADESTLSYAVLQGDECRLAICDTSIDGEGGQSTNVDTMRVSGDALRLLIMLAGGDASNLPV